MKTVPVFWPLLEKFMVESFNEAYNKKEMSHAQKQAVNTLIEKKGRTEIIWKTGDRYP